MSNQETMINTVDGNRQDNTDPSDEVIEQMLLSGTVSDENFVTQLKQCFEKLSQGKGINHSSIGGYSPCSQFKNEVSTQKTRYTPVFYNLKLAYLTQEQRLNEIRSGEFRDCVAPPRESDASAKTQEELFKMRIFIFTEKYRRVKKESESSTDAKIAIEQELAQHFGWNIESQEYSQDEVSTISTAIQGDKMRFLKALVRIYLSEMYERREEIKKAKEDQQTEFDSLELPKSIKKLDMLEYYALTTLQSFSDEMLMTDKSVRDFCQFICMLICTESAFDNNLDAVAIILKRFAKVLVSVKNDANILTLYDQVLYSLAIVAYRLIKQATEYESILAKYKKMSCAEAQTKTLQLLNNCKILSEGEHDYVTGELSTIQQCFNQFNSQQALPEENTILQSIINENDQQNLECFKKLCKDSATICFQFRFDFESRIKPHLQCIKKHFAVKLKQGNLVTEFGTYLSEQNRNDQIERLWGDSGRFVFSKLQNVQNSDENLEREYKESFKQKLSSRAEFLLKLGCSEEKFLDRCSLTEHDLRQFKFFEDLQKLMGYNLFQYLLSHTQGERFYLHVQQFQGAMCSYERKNKQSTATQQCLIRSNNINKCSRKQLQQVIKTIVASLKDAEDNMQYLISAICRQYTAEDFQFFQNEQILEKLNSISNDEMNNSTVQGQSQQAQCSILSQIITSFSQSSPESPQNNGLLDKVKLILFENLKKQNDEAADFQRQASSTDSVRQDSLTRSQTIRRTSERTGKLIIDENQEYQCIACGYQNPLNTKCELCNTDQKDKIEEYKNKEVTQWQSLLNLKLLLTVFRAESRTLETDDLLQIMRLADQSLSPYNQMFALKLLQSILKYSQVGSVEDAASNLIEGQQSVLNCPESKLIQMLVNWTYDKNRKHFVCSEIQRTVKVILQDESENFAQQRNALSKMLNTELNRLDNLNENKVSTLMSLMPLMSPRNIAVGSHCIDQSITKEEDEYERTMTVIGYYQDSNKRSNIYPSAQNTDYTSLKGIQTSTDKISFLVKDLSNLQSVVDPNPNVRKYLANSCLILRNSELLKVLIAKIKESSQSQVNDRKYDILTLFLFRGISQILEIQEEAYTEAEIKQGDEYINFLYQNELLEPLIEILRPYTKKSSDGFFSSEHLEMLAISLEKYEPAEASTSLQSILEEEEKESPSSAPQAKKNSFSRTMSDMSIRDNVFDEKLLSQIHAFFEKPAYQKENNEFDYINKIDKNSRVSRLQQCQQDLIQNKARQILLIVQSRMPEIDEDQLGEDNFQLLYDEHALASKLGFKKSLERTQIKIRKVLVHIQATEEAKGAQPSKTQQFVENLLDRGNRTILKQFSAKDTKKIGSGLLYAQNLLYFSKLSLDMNIINLDDVENPRLLYDLILTFGFGFHEDEDISSSSKLFKAAKVLLEQRVINAGIENLTIEQARDLFANQLINKIFFKDCKSQRLLANSRCQDLFEIIKILYNKYDSLRTRASPVWEGEEIKEDEIKKPTKKLEKILEMWKAIKLGMNKESPLWKQLKISLALQDKESQKTIDWGKCYTTDEYAYDDIQFKTTIDQKDEDQVIFIEKNTTDQTVKVTLKKDQEVVDQYFFNQRRLEAIKRKQVIVEAGSTAEIEIQKSFSNVIASGQFNFRAKMLSRDWRTLFDSSQMPQLKQVLADVHTALFVCENDKIFGFGKGLAGTSDRGWLREIKKPANCTNIKKVVHQEKFRMILTNEGKVFVNGKSTAWRGKTLERPKDTQGNKGTSKPAAPIDKYSRVFTLIEEPEDSDEVMEKDQESVLQEFKEVDIAKDFPDRDVNDKIVDIEVNPGSDHQCTGLIIVTESRKLFVRCPDLNIQVQGFKLTELKNKSVKQSAKGDKQSIQILNFEKDGDKSYTKMHEVLVKANNFITDSNSYFHCYFWVNAENDSGDKITFGVGRNDDIFSDKNMGHVAIICDEDEEDEDNEGDDDEEGKEGEEEKENDDNKAAFITKITQTKYMNCVLDSKNRLWLWEDVPSKYNPKLWYQPKKEEGEEDEDEFQYGPVEEPKRIRWFDDQKLTVIDIEGSKKTLIIKVKDKDDNIYFYGMPCRPYDIDYEAQDEDYQMLQQRQDDDGPEEETKDVGFVEKMSSDVKAENMIGILSGEHVEDVGGGILYKLGVSKDQSKQKDKDILDCSRVTSFSCSAICTFFVYKAPENLDINQSEPVQANNFFHYYKDANGEWALLQKQEYEQKKNEESFPNICLATRQKIDLDQQERKDSLNKVWDNIHCQTEDAEESKQDQLPKYYSNCIINGQAQEITVTEQEFCEGGQQWDLNPLIFYRFKKPIKINNNDPENKVEIKLNEIFEQNREISRQIIIQVRNKKVPELKVEEALNKVSAETQEIIDQLQEFTDKEDGLILTKMETIMRQIFPKADELKLNNPREKNEKAKSMIKVECKGCSNASCLGKELQTDFVLNSGQFNFQYSDFGTSKSELLLKNNIINMRVQLLLKLNMCFYKLFKFVNHEYRLFPETNHGKHFQWKDKVIQTLVLKLIKEQIFQIAFYNDLQGVPKFALDRTEEAKQAVLQQVISEFKKYAIEQQKKMKPEEKEQAKNERPDPMFLKVFRFDKIKAQPFKIKAAEDAKEQLVDQGGAYNEAMSCINSELMDTREDRKVQCLKQCPSYKGVYMINERAKTEEQEDRELFVFLGAILAFAFLTGQCFGIELAKPVWKQLIGDKLTIDDVKEVDLDAYERLRSQNTSLEDVEQGTGGIKSNPKLDKAVNQYFDKFREQVKLMNEGMDLVLDGKHKFISYLPVKIFQERICGRPDVKTEDLQKITTYEKPRKPYIEKWFWQVFDEFTPEMKTQYLIFTQAKARLPLNLDRENFDHKFKVYEEREKKHEQTQKVIGVQHQKNSLPKSHTCFFRIELMEYDSKELLKDQLIYAMQNAQGIED